MKIDINNIKWPSIGNDRVTDYLQQSIRNDKLAQSYVFIGPDNLGKYTIALSLANNLLLDNIEDDRKQEELLTSNSDLHVLRVEDDKKNISIDQVREFIKILNLSSFMGSYKIGIIKEAHNLSSSAQHALLKTLEEPKEGVIIILLTNNEKKLLNTILSRSQLLYFYSVPQDTIYHYLLDNYKLTRTLAKDITSLTAGKPLQAIRFAENIDLYNNYLQEIRKIADLVIKASDNKLKYLDTIIKGSLQSKEASDIINVVEGILRDLLLLSLNQAEYLHYSVLQDDFQKVLKENDEDYILDIVSKLKLVNRAKEYLTANVSPRLCLEQLVLNL